tara:strand:- start:1698 stop:1931 length:234 start_codon:yes stop_codon:yes gene_type:complete
MRETKDNKTILEAQINNEQIVNTYGYGEVAIWNYILCKQQDAEMENDAENWITYVEFGLCDESEECQKAFETLGVLF